MNTPVFLSPPVVQQAGEHGFTVSIEVGRLCMGRVEWGQAPDALAHVAVSAFGGLRDADAQCLMIRVDFPQPVAAGSTVYYRVVAEPLHYVDAYDIRRDAEAATAVRALRLPPAAPDRVSIAMVNDTHAKPKVVDRLAPMIDELDPDLLVWNGDFCSKLNADDNPAAVLLRPGAEPDDPSAGGWAATRPLLYTPGNHDLRGVLARQRPRILAPGPEPGLPYNRTLRLGPLAVIVLDTGEDKPDHHPVFAGTAAYEPYRRAQADWLQQALQRPEIADAPFRLAFCHIPLRGLPGQNDGSTLEGYADYSGHGAALWLPQLIAADFQAVISGHKHENRIDPPTPDTPITQIVGGGPHRDTARLTIITATPERLTIRITDLDGETTMATEWAQD